MFSCKTTSFAISLLAATVLSTATPLRDSIPRERLISNAEFFRALDLRRKREIVNLQSTDIAALSGLRECRPLDILKGIS